MAQATSTIVDVEREFWDKAHDAEYFERVFAEDGVTVIEPMGFIDKEKALKMVDPDMKWKDVEMSDVRTIQITPDCAAILYHAKATKGDSTPYQASMATVYAKRDGDWKLVLSIHQPWDPNSKKEG